RARRAVRSRAGRKLNHFHNSVLDDRLRCVSLKFALRERSNTALPDPRNGTEQMTALPLAIVREKLAWIVAQRSRAMVVLGLLLTGVGVIALGWFLLSLIGG